MLNEKIVTLEQIKEAEKLKQGHSEAIEEYLISQGFLKEDILIKKIKEVSDIEIIDFDSIILNQSAIKLLTKEMARKYWAVPFEILEDVLQVAVYDPFNQEAVDEIKFITKKNIKLYCARLSQIKRAVEIYYNDEAREAALEELKKEKANNIKESSFIETSANVDNAPVVRLINSIIYQAVSLKASDIHIEPFEDEVSVRFRIDGMLKDITKIPKENYPAVSTRIKIISKMDITERRIPQDGKVKINFNHMEYDFRVSSLPTLHGEKIVLRILYKTEFLNTLEHLGFDGTGLSEIRNILGMSYGMVLVSGPTGSGKSTTLYSMINEINSREKNIITIEDPVEYSIYGINQVSINNKSGLSFASGLRSILRQDPNVIMIGEIRDEETAQIAVRAAITGHLVLSTLHTNDAVSSILRLINMGVPKYLVASALSASIAQRLVRKVCSHCKIDYYPSIREQKLLQLEEGQKIFKGKGCPRCSYTGYSGRTVTFELMKINNMYRDLLSTDISMDQLKRQSANQGLATMMDNCRELIMKGVTTSEEYLRLFQVI